MGRKDHQKRARDAQTTRDFFAQMPTMSSRPAVTPAPQPPTSAPAPSARIPLPAPGMLPPPTKGLPYLPDIGDRYLTSLFDGEKPEAYETLLLFGEECRQEYLNAKDAFREQTIQSFISAYSFVDKESRRVFWGLDTDIASLVADQIAAGAVIGLFTNGTVNGGVLPGDIVIQAPDMLEQYDVISLIVDLLLERVEEDSAARNLGGNTQNECDTPIFALALVHVTALSRLFYYTDRVDNNFWHRLRRLRYPKMEAYYNLNVPGEGLLTSEEMADVLAMISARAKPGNAAGSGSGSGSAPAAATMAMTAKVAGVEIPLIDGHKRKGVHLKKEAAMRRLSEHLDRLLQIDYPSAEARREVLGRARADILKSETYRDATRGKTSAQTTSFPIGSGPDWLGDLERMQAMALQGCKKVEEDENQGQ